MNSEQIQPEFCCNNCNKWNFKPLPGSTLTCECGMKHVFCQHEPIREVSGENWREILEGTATSIEEQLRKLYPHGHERFIKLSLNEMSLHSKKNYDYAHGGDPLGNFVRVANILSNYPGLKLTPPVVALVYAMKQLDAVLWQLSQGYEGTVEGIDDKAQDIHVYVKLFRILLEEHDHDD